MKYSKIKIELMDGSIEEHMNIAKFDAVAPINGAFNFYDLKGVLHSWNWNMIKKITITQVEGKDVSS